MQSFLEKKCMQNACHLKRGICHFKQMILYLNDKYDNKKLYKASIY